MPFTIALALAFSLFFFTQYFAISIASLTPNPARHPLLTPWVPCALVWGRIHPPIRFA